MLTNFNFFTNQIIFVTGVDEVGRGALAGPMIAGAVGFDLPKMRLIQKSDWHHKINDSKKLSEKVRKELSLAICENLPYAIGSVSVGEIDSWGLTRANQVVIQRAMEQLPNVDLVIGDGNLKVPCDYVEYRPIVKADQTVWLVAAASIIAKVERDNLMHNLHTKYPEYGFDKHVGYGTKFHRDAIRQYGPCEIHRTCFKLT